MEMVEPHLILTMGNICISSNLKPLTNWKKATAEEILASKDRNKSVTITARDLRSEGVCQVKLFETEKK